MNHEQNQPEIPVWDLSILYKGQEERIKDIEKLKNAALEFQNQYRKKTVDLTEKELLEAFHKHEKIYNTLARLSAHAHLQFAADTSDPKAQSLVASQEELSAEIHAQIVFFDLELARTKDKFLNSEILKDYRYHIERLVLMEKYNLSEELEAYGMEKNLTGVQAFSNLFDEIFGQFKFRMKTNCGEETFTEETALASLHSPDRDYRHQVYEKFLSLVGENKIVLGNIYNNIIFDHRLDCKRRGFQNLMTPRNLSNQVSDESVESMLETVESGYHLAQKYFRIKSDLMGLRNMTNADIYAPLSSEKEEISFQEAKETVIESYSSFDEDAGKIVSKFFNKRADIPLREGKRPGAFCYGPSPQIDAFVHMNYTGDIRSVQTLAHELGHGLHHQLSKSQNHLNFDTPLVTAETASVFGEILLNELMFENASSKEKKLSILFSQMEGVIATVFRQTVLTRFEQRAHAARDEGKVQPETFCDFWWEENKKLYGDAVKMVEPYRWGWAYIPHFIHTPFYCYAYSFGQLLVLSLYAEYLKKGTAFKSGYLKLLSSGGSESPENLVKNSVGLNLNDPSFWKLSLSILEENLKRIESLL
ncbi:MAG: M3 family oligoendopeptidase [Spirochaetia bacterium]|nr:M3 family oligoendopeptidase [Spirochaetia bacterium]